MVYYICHCMSSYVYLGDFFLFWIAVVWPFFFFFFFSFFFFFLFKKLSSWLLACSVLRVVPLLKVRPSFPLVSWNERC